MSAPEAPGQGIVSAQTNTLIGAETGIKTIAAVHSQCRSWVISDRSIQRQSRPMSAVPPIADKRGRNLIVRFVPLAVYSPLTAFQIASVININHRR
jgi:hypothetical protein